MVLENASKPMSVIGIVTVPRFVHPENAKSPMDVTESGMVAATRLVHPRNAARPMAVTEPGMVAATRLVHP